MQERPTMILTTPLWSPSCTDSKHLIIVQKLASVVEFWALLSSCWLPLIVDHSCDAMYVTMHVLGQNIDAVKHCSMWLFLCESFRYSLRLIFVGVLQATDDLQPVAALPENSVRYWNSTVFFSNGLKGLVRLQKAMAWCTTQCKMLPSCLCVNHLIWSYTPGRGKIVPRDVINLNK